MIDFLLAWRNIWRNPRRTAVILVAVIIGVWSMISLAALMRGVIGGMVKNNIDTLTGHIQIHERNYPDDPIVDYRIQQPDTVIQNFKKHLPEGSIWTQRIRLNAVAANARHSTGIIMVGIEPEKEANISFIGTSVKPGRFLNPDDTSGIIIGKALADQLETRIGKKLILMSLDSTGEIASRAFRIVGIFQAEMEATEKSYVFINISTAQKMLKLDNSISEISIKLPEYEMSTATAAQLQLLFQESELKVRSWQEILPLITSLLKLYDLFIFIWFLVTFIAMAFGIVNTTLMSVFERMREFGLLKALGMKPGRIIKSILTESSLILLLGMVIGTFLGLLTNWALSFEGIDLSALAEGVEYAGMARIIYPVVMVKDIINANLVVLCLGLLVSLYPAVKAARFTPVEALTHV